MNSQTCFSSKQLQLDQILVLRQDDKVFNVILRICLEALMVSGFFVYYPDLLSSGRIKFLIISGVIAPCQSVFK